MAIYRPPRPRWPLAVVSALFGIGAGFVAAILFIGDPDPRETALDVRSELGAAAGSLEVAAIEYNESVDNGEIVSENEYRGAQSALDSSRARFNDTREVLDVLAPELAESLAGDYEQVAALMEDVAEPAEVEAVLEELAAQLRLGES